GSQHRCRLNWSEGSREGSRTGSSSGRFQNRPTNSRSLRKVGGRPKRDGLKNGRVNLPNDKGPSKQAPSDEGRVREELLQMMNDSPQPSLGPFGRYITFSGLGMALMAACTYFFRAIEQL